MIAQQLFPYGGRAACSTDVGAARLSTLQLSPPPALRGTWFTHRP